MEKRAVKHSNYEIVEHTADWAVRIWGADFLALLCNSAYAMNSLVVADVGKIVATQARHFVLEAYDRESMLVEWLGELAYWLETESLVCTEFAFAVAEPTLLDVRVKGGFADALEKHIKAVTYHDLVVRERDGGLMATVVFDV